jgi:UDP-glucose 4-epimerase
VRDYVHVSDLAEAHVRALEYLMNGGMSIALNLGTGKGHSVMQVICAVEKATGRKVSYRVASRRAGDPAVLIADPSLAGKVLAWRPEHSCLDTIVKSAWKWHSREVFA